MRHAADLKRLFVSGTYICPAGHKMVKPCSVLSFDFLTLEDGTDTLSQNIGK